MLKRIIIMMLLGYNIWELEWGDGDVVMESWGARLEGPAKKNRGEKKI